MRSRQTYEEILKAIDPKNIMGAQEEVQLREQDFGNFQVATYSRPLGVDIPPCPLSAVDIAHCYFTMTFVKSAGLIIRFQSKYKS